MSALILLVEDDRGLRCVATVALTAAGFRVYPPEDTASLFVARPSDACSNASIELLSIGAFQAR